MSNVANWVSQETTTAGTGVITLGAAIAGSATWVQAFGAGTVSVLYSVESGDDRESGIGSFDGTAGTLTRSDVRSTLVSGVYDDTSPTPITLSGTSVVSCTLNATSYLQDAVFSTYAGFDAENLVPSVAGTTTVDFASGNLQRITGSNATTLGDWTFPSPGSYRILIDSTVTVIGQTTANATEFGAQAYPYTAAKEHLIRIDWNGTTARWSAIPEI